VGHVGESGAPIPTHAQHPRQDTRRTFVVSKAVPRRREGAFPFNSRTSLALTTRAHYSRAGYAPTMSAEARFQRPPRRNICRAKPSSAAQLRAARHQKSSTLHSQHADAALPPITHVSPTCTCYGSPERGTRKPSDRNSQGRHHIATCTCRRRLRSRQGRRHQQTRQAACPWGMMPPHRSLGSKAPRNTSDCYQAMVSLAVDQLTSQHTRPQAYLASVGTADAHRTHWPDCHSGSGVLVATHDWLVGLVLASPTCTRCGCRKGGTRKPSDRNSQGRRHTPRGTRQSRRRSRQGRRHSQTRQAACPLGTSRPHRSIGSNPPCTPSDCSSAIVGPASHP
jgi:hypothetical protein